MGKYDDLETTAQRVYKYLRERIGDTPQFVRYTEIAEEVGRTRSSVSYAVRKRGFCGRCYPAPVVFLVYCGGILLFAGRKKGA